VAGGEWLEVEPMTTITIEKTIEVLCECWNNAAEIIVIPNSLSEHTLFHHWIVTLRVGSVAQTLY